MSRGLGVVRYCTPEGGSGYIANGSLPWLSSFNITQQAPVYDQETAWLRNSQPGSYTNYARFGPPYSIDGGVLPPYMDAPIPGGPGDPEPFQTSCGMGDLTLLRSDVVAPMPSITSAARAGCTQVSNCPGDLGTWISSNPWLAAGLALVGGFVLFGGGRR
jgi:hypothetical protein